jgi:hypothetical protein
VLLHLTFLFLLCLGIWIRGNKGWKFLWRIGGSLWCLSLTRNRFICVLCSVKEFGLSVTFMITYNSMFWICLIICLFVLFLYNIFRNSKERKWIQFS